MNEFATFDMLPFIPLHFLCTHFWQTQKKDMWRQSLFSCALMEPPAHWSSASVVNHTIVTDPTIWWPGWNLQRPQYSWTDTSLIQTPLYELCLFCNVYTLRYLMLSANITAITHFQNLCGQLFRQCNPVQWRRRCRHQPTSLQTTAWYVNLRLWDTIRHTHTCKLAVLLP